MTWVDLIEEGDRVSWVTPVGQRRHGVVIGLSNDRHRRLRVLPDQSQVTVWVPRAKIISVDRENDERAGDTGTGGTEHPEPGESDREEREGLQRPVQGVSEGVD